MQPQTGRNIQSDDDTPNYIIDVIADVTGVTIERVHTGRKHYGKVSLNWFIFWLEYLNTL